MTALQHFTRASEHLAKIKITIDPAKDKQVCEDIKKGTAQRKQNIKIQQKMGAEIDYLKISFTRWNKDLKEALSRSRFII